MLRGAHVDIYISINGVKRPAQNLIKDFRMFKNAENELLQKGRTPRGKAGIRFLMEITHCDEETAEFVRQQLFRIVDWVDSHPKQELDASLFDGLHEAGYISDEDYAKLEAQSTYVPRCPDIKKISGLSRAVSFEAFGFASSTARAQRQCRNCGYKF